MNKSNKVNKDEFLERVTARLQSQHTVDEMAARGSCHLFTVREMYEAMIEEVKDIVRVGDRLSLTGFGSFYSQLHRGHPVQFGGKQKNVQDYQVFKFSASNVLNRELRQEDSEGD